MKKRVIIFSSEFPPGPGGIGNHAFCLANQLYAKGFVVTVISEERKEFESNKRDSISEYRVIRVKKQKWKFVKYIKLLTALNKQVRREKGAVVISSGMLTHVLLGFFSLYTFYPFVSIAVGHGIDINSSNWFYRRMVNFSLSRCQRIVSVSNYTAEKIEPKFKRKLVVINNGFDKSKLDASVKGNHQKGSPALITVGSISERKGQRNLVLALPAIIADYPGVHFHCVGIDTHKKIITTAADALNLHSYITLYGAVENARMSELLSGSDIFVMLSDHTKDGDFEGFGIAILEANYLGLPAIGSKKSGIADAILDGQTGILVDQHNPEDIARSIRTILKNYDSYSANAKAHAINFTWESVVEPYIKIIDEL